LDFFLEEGVSHSAAQCDDNLSSIRYNVKERRRHGEAASVDLEAVEKERLRMRELLAPYAMKDRFNGDETGLFGRAPPERGLSMAQMSGKKKNKWRITILFSCNADGSEKLPPMFIGRWKRPRCFGKKSVESYGFYYRNNRRAWMTSELFEEWVILNEIVTTQLMPTDRYIKHLDLIFRRQNRHIAYTLDNFSGHEISYIPTNILLIPFEPNLTPFVQPLDAGIIRCFKAHYRKAFCLRALDLDEAGEAGIFDINQLEVMKMAREGWAAVSCDTIKNCWAHTGIQRDPIPPIKLRLAPQTATLQCPINDLAARVRSILRTWAKSTSIQLPKVTTDLQEILGVRFVEKEWHGIFDAVLGAEDNTEAALAALRGHKLPSFDDEPATISDDESEAVEAAASLPVPATSQALGAIHVSKQGQQLEADLMNAVAELRRRNRIHGVPMTVEELVAPEAENEVGEGDFIFEGGDDEIVARVRHEAAVKRGDIVEVESDDEEEASAEGAGVSNRELQSMCKMLELACISNEVSSSMELPRLLRRFRGELMKAEQQSAKQTTLEAFAGFTQHGRE
jgi:hypothetical protein